MKRRVGTVAGVGLVVLCVVAGVGFVAFGSRGGGPYPASIQSLANYPGATVLSISTPGPQAVPTDTFQGLIFLDTTDSDQQVYAFYDNRLLNAGWVALP